MKAADLMIKDWVLVEGKPLQVTNISCLGGDIIRVMNPFMSYDIVYASNIVALSNGAKDINKIEPIPLTPEILEKNGFTNYDVGHNVKGWTIMDEEYCSDIPFTLTDNDFDTEQGDYKWGPVEDDREASYVSEVGRIKYVHELQHVLKTCGIEKEIIL